LLDPQDQHATLLKIDRRQDLILEDLDRLNQQIVNIIDLYATNRATQEAAASTQEVDAAKDPAADRSNAA